MQAYLNQLMAKTENLKYFNWYSNIVTAAKTRGTAHEAKRVLGYIENHHILPKCMCESKKDIWTVRNKVALTAREHFIVHRLLAKMMPRHSTEYYKMVYAISSFVRRKDDRNLTSRQYEIARKSCAEASSNRVVSPHTRQMQSIRQTNVVNMYDADGNVYVLTKGDPIIKELGLVGNQKRKTTAIDKNGNTMQVSTDDPRLSTGELSGIKKRMATYRDTTGKKYYLSIDSELITQLNLVHIATGRKMSDEVCKMYSVRSSGTNNNMYGKVGEVCCYDIVNSKFVRIPKPVFDANKNTQYVGANHKLAKAARLSVT